MQTDFTIVEMDTFLNRMFPCNGTYLRYKDAVSAVQKVKQEERRESMLYLLKKVSDSATLDNAVQKLKSYDTDVNDKKLKKIYAEFDKQDINPITLPNSSSIAEMIARYKVIPLRVVRRTELSYCCIYVIMHNIFPKCGGAMMRIIHQSLWKHLMLFCMRYYFVNDTMLAA